MWGVIHSVLLSAWAKKQLRAVPAHVKVKLLAWVRAVEQTGLEEVRKVPGFHDEPLKGKRSGQRSIRLSLAYRAFYTLQGETLKFVCIEEVSKHEY